MITLYNDVHNTQTRIQKTVGDEISEDEMNQIETRLCGIKDCLCDGIRGPQDVDIVSRKNSFGGISFLIVRNNSLSPTRLYDLIRDLLSTRSKRELMAACRGKTYIFPLWVHAFFLGEGTLGLSDKHFKSFTTINTYED